jgi:hypothetical protein
VADRQENDLEWEQGAQPTVLETGVVFPDPPFVPGTVRVTIDRDEEFTLRLHSEGALPDYQELRRRHESYNAIPEGTFLDPVEVEFSAPSSKCCLKAHVNYVPSTEQRGRDRPRFSLDGRPVHFRRVWTTKAVVGADGEPAFAPVGPEAWRSDWYINGPHATVYCRGTSRRREGTFKRERSMRVGNVTLRDWPTGGLSNFDHLGVDSTEARFAFCEVPDGLAPEWTSPASIEFPGPVPDANVRDAVAEIVSFAIGRRLMRVGSSVFDASGTVIESEIINPWGQGIRRLCSYADRSPFTYGQPSDDMERLLAMLVPRYLGCREQFGLQDALLTYWLASESFALVDLALYSSALESLKNGWFKSTRSKSKGAHIPEEQFTAALAEPLQQIDRIVTDKSLPAAIARKIRGAFRMGSNEQLDAFFEEIGLRVGKVERAAIQARNTPAHGGISAGADQRKFARLGNAYRVLFERTLLKLLQYDGGYVDRTAPDHPVRHIDEPCAGNATW